MEPNGAPSIETFADEVCTIAFDDGDVGSLVGVECSSSMTIGSASTTGTTICLLRARICSSLFTRCGSILPQESDEKSTQKFMDTHSSKVQI